MSNPTRDLRLLAGAVAASAAGDLILVVVLALRVHDLTGSGFAVAALFAALMGPIALLASPAGRLVDRFETRRTLALVSAAQALVAAGLVFATGLAAILPLAALLGAGAAVAGPAEAALVPAVARDLRRANGWIESARYAGYTVGPLIAGALTAAGGTRVALAVNAASFAAVALVATMLRVRREPSPGGEAQAGAGGRAFSLLLADRTVRAAVLAAVAGLLFISASMTVEVFYVRDVVGAGSFGYALVFAGWTAGMVAGALAVAPKARATLAAGAMLALATQGAGMAAAALWAVLPWVIAGYAVGGVGHGAKNVLMRTLIQTRVAAAQHGRAFAAYGAARNTAELAALGIGGVLVTAIGAQPALLIAGLGPVVAGLAALAAASAGRLGSAAAASRAADPHPG